MSFQERKESRKEHYYRYQYGWRKRKCIACNGSGYYDHNGTPDCANCSGTGKETYRPDEVTEWLKANGKI